MQKDKYCMIPLIWGTRIVKFINTESGIGATKKTENVTKKKKPDKQKVEYKVSKEEWGIV